MGRGKTRMNIQTKKRTTMTLATAQVRCAVLYQLDSE
eukprot:COSAG05_NODE_196_length_14546_cov_55.423548_7_plen_37_part_00